MGVWLYGCIYGWINVCDMQLCDPWHLLRKTAPVLDSYFDGPAQTRHFAHAVSRNQGFGLSIFFYAEL